jgi:hypothetical protein
LAVSLDASIAYMSHVTWDKVETGRDRINAEGGMRSAEWKKKAVFTGMTGMEGMSRGEETGDWRREKENSGRSIQNSPFSRLNSSHYPLSIISYAFAFDYPLSIDSRVE